jgi:hypothetical protein
MARKMGKGYATYMGFESEPPQPHGPKEKGKAAIHSHSARPRHKLQVGKRVSKGSTK